MAWNAVRQGHVLFAVVPVLVVAIAAWQVPCHCRFTESGLELGWLGLKQRVGFASIDAVRITDAERRGFFPRRALALVVERKHGRPLVLFAHSSALQHLQAAYEAHQAAPRLASRAG